MSVKKQLLDPLGTMCKLVSLNFRKKNTKVSIQDHILILQNPSRFQWAIRWCNGDGRENLSELYYAIIRLIKWFLVPSKTNEEKCNVRVIAKNKMFRRMVKYMCDGLKHLQETYEYGNVVLTIQFYINILEDGLNGQYNDKKLPKYIKNKEKEYDNLLDYDKIKNLWDVKDIERICKLYENCFRDNSSDSIVDEAKETFVNGYLKSVDAILKMTDLKFQELVENSTKG